MKIQQQDFDVVVLGGGSAGVAYLETTVAKRAFPELWSLRTRL